MAEVCLAGGDWAGELIQAPGISLVRANSSEIVLSMEDLRWVCPDQGRRVIAAVLMVRISAF